MKTLIYANNDGSMNYWKVGRAVYVVVCVAIHAIGSSGGIPVWMEQAVIWFTFPLVFLAGIVAAAAACVVVVMGVNVLFGILLGKNPFECFSMYYKETKRKLSTGCGSCYNTLRNWMNS